MPQSEWKLAPSEMAVLDPKAAVAATPLALIDAEGRFTSANGAAYTLFGWSGQEEVVPDVLARLRATRAWPMTFEVAHRPVLAVEVPGGGWLLAGWPSVVEAHAPQDETSFQSLIEKLPALVVRLDAEGVIRYASPEAVPLTGHDPAALAGVAFWQAVIHPEDRWRVADAIRQAQRGAAGSLKARLLRADGAVRVMHLHVFRDGDGVGGCLSDVTAETEQTLLQGEGLYRIFLEQSPLGLLHLDAEGVVTFENHALRQMIGERPEDAWIGRRLYHVDGLDGRFRLRVRAMLEGGRRIAYAEADYRRGGLRRLRFHGAPIQEPGGAVVGGVLVVEDVTEQWASAEAFRVAKEQAEAANRLKTSFIATMSHELRTPLASVSGYAELMANELEDYEARTGHALPPQLLEFADAISSNTQRLLALANDLFDLSNVEMGALPITLLDVSLHEVLFRSVLRIEPALAEKGLQFDIDLAPESPRVRADPRRLEQVFDNLLSNAVKFTSEGRIAVRTWSEGREAGVAVTDTGVGMAPAYLSDLFTPFVQEDRRLNRRYGGTGLGLALVKRFLDRMDGRIEVESQKGAGATFRVYLPLVPSALGEAGAASIGGDGG